MDRYIVNKKDLHLLKRRNYLQALSTMASTKKIADTDNLDFHNLPFVAICLTDSEKAILQKNGVELVLNKKRNALLGRWNGAQAYQPTQGPYPFVETGVDKYDHKNIRGRGIKVAYMDTGFTPYTTCNVDFGVNVSSGDPSFADDVGHGTHTTSICKNSAWGIAPNTICHMIKAVPGGSIDEANFLAGVSYCIAQGIQLVNMSFFISDTASVIQTAITSLINAGCIPIVAAGNSGPAAEIGLPASCFGAVAVGGSAPAVNHIPQVASFTSLVAPAGGQGITIMAPGANVPISGDDGSGQGNGTSYSAPYILSALACIMEEQKCTNFKALTILKANAIRSSNALLGSGFLNCP